MKLESYEVKVPEGRESEGYVYLRHNTQYTIALTSWAGIRCDAEVWVDGRKVGVWRIPDGGRSVCVVLERPVHDTGRFTFYEVGSREARRAGISESDQLGLLTVLFKPEKDALPPLFAPPTPTEGYAGGTGLSGRSAQEFSEAAPIEYDLSQAVTIHLRLAGDPDEPRPMFQRETAVPPPVAPRSRDRQVNQSLESDSTEKSSGFTHLPTAEDKGTPRPQALPPKHSLPPLPLRVPPKAQKKLSGTNERFTQEELLNVVSHRENIFNIYGTAVLASAAFRFVQPGDHVALILQLLIWAGVGTSFYLLASAMKEENAWWAFVAAFLPLVNLFMLFRLRSKATKVLKNYGVTISKAFQMRNDIRRMSA